MYFEITFKNPTTGEDESQKIDKDNCWDILSSLYSSAIPDEKIKFIGFKLKLKFGNE